MRQPTRSQSEWSAVPGDPPLMLRIDLGRQLLRSGGWWSPRTSDCGRGPVSDSSSTRSRPSRPLISISKYVQWAEPSRNRPGGEFGPQLPWGRLISPEWSCLLPLHLHLFTVYIVHAGPTRRNPAEWQEVPCPFQKEFWSANSDCQMLCGPNMWPSLPPFQTYCKVVTVCPKSLNCLLHGFTH